nr:hypothetical protein [Tanacetum cinerariifolium]
MAGYKNLSWGAKRARTIRVVKARRSDSETSYEDNVPISTLVSRPRIKTNYEDEGDHDLNSTDSFKNGRTSSEYEETNNDLEEISESSDEDEDNNDDLEEFCESTHGDEENNNELEESSESSNKDEEDNDELEDNEDQEKELEDEDGSLNESIIFISENDSVHANGGSDSGDECDDETDYDVNTSIMLVVARPFGFIGPSRL